jgi:hypothetical protein
VTLLIAIITLPLVSSCLLLWKCGLVINLVGTLRGIVSHVGAFDMSHLLLLNLAHALLFFLPGAISYMVTLFLAPKASDESLLRLKLHLGGLRALLFYLGAALPHVSWNLCILELNSCSLDRLYFLKFPFDFTTIGLVTFLMGLDACFG